jgi:membrane protein implicated in regulation of membrane protease activity
MPVFEWNAHPSWPGISSGFWVYWVVTIPLTVIVLYIWRYWFIGADQHQRRDDARVIGEEYVEMSKLHRILLRNHDTAKTHWGAASA